MYLFLAAAIEDTQNLDSFENEKSLSGNFEGWCARLSVVFVGRSGIIS